MSIGSHIKMAHNMNEQMHNWLLRRIYMCSSSSFSCSWQLALSKQTQSGVQCGGTRTWRNITHTLIYVSMGAPYFNIIICVIWGVTIQIYYPRCYETTCLYIVHKSVEMHQYKEPTHRYQNETYNVFVSCGFVQISILVQWGVEIRSSRILR